PDTLFDSIKQITGDEVLYINKENEFKLIKKTENVSSIEFVDFIENLKISLNNSKISCDLTGGMDSRLLAVALKYYNLSFSSFTALSQAKKEFLLAKEISDILKIEHLEMENTFSNADSELKLSNILSEGLVNTINMHRNIQVADLRKRHGINLVFNGNGGELYKEIYIMHEFPFYTIGKFDPHKLYKMRIEPIGFNFNLLNANFVDLRHRVDESRISKMKKLILTGKIESIMNIRYKLIVPALTGTISSVVINNYYDVYSPFLEYSLFLYSIKQNVSEKVFDMWHRKLITKYNREVARLSTTNDVTSSSEYRYIIKDGFITFYNRGYRLLRKISQKALKKTLFLGSSLSDSYYSDVRNSHYVRENLQFLIEIGILKKNTDINYINNNTLGNLISISHFLQEMEK
ncbi:MAG: asparagine synthase-related protein, partial [bacterium]